MKKFAIKALAAVAAFIALCMFFSGTIKTITTPKVKLVAAKQGKLEEKIKLRGKLVFPQTHEVILSELGDDQQVIVSRVRVSVGRHVKAGDVLFESEVSGYQSALEELSKEIDAAQKELMDLERTSGDIRLKRTEENWIAAYDALAQAKRDVREAQTELDVAGQLAAGQNDERVLAAQQALAAAKASEAKAKTAFDSANRLGISESVVTYVTKSRELNAEIEQAQADIAALRVLAAKVQTVTAPHDGYVVEIHVKAGESYAGKSAAVVMSAADMAGVLRADVSDIDRRIEEKTEVSMTRTNGKTLTAKVSGGGMDADGKAYIDVPLTEKEITNLGGAAALMSEETEMTASYRAQHASTLLPISAVRGSGEGRYVFVVDEGSNALGERTLTIRKQDVTVLAEVGATASIEEDLGRQRVAYMEDRAISEGSVVMTYPQ